MDLNSEIYLNFGVVEFFVYTEQNRIFILFKHINLITITKFQMHGLLNMHIQSNNYSLDSINFTIVLE